jgi:hypothetical protein
VEKPAQFRVETNTGALPASAFSAAGCTLVFVLSTLLASFSILLAAAALAALVWHFRSPRLAHHRPLGWCTRPNTAERKCSAVSVLYRSDTAPFVIYSSAPLQKWLTFSCYQCPRSALGLKPVWLLTPELGPLEKDVQLERENNSWQTGATRRGPRPKDVVSDTTAETPQGGAAQSMRGSRSAQIRKTPPQKRSPLSRTGQGTLKAPERPVGRTGR